MTNIGIENNFYILDTDYLNYFVYYNCYFLDISGYRKKIGSIIKFTYYNSNDDLQSSSE